MSNLALSIVRTFIPYLVGLLAVYGLELDAEIVAGLTGVLAFLISMVYYIVFRLLEKKFPQLGWFLGSPSKPVYTDVRA